MARLAVSVLLLLCFLAVARSRLLKTTATAALAVPDERDPPERASAAEGSEHELVAVPLHRLAGPGVFRDVGFSLRLPARGRHHPCRGGVHGRRPWSQRHHDGFFRARAVVDGRFPDDPRADLAMAIMKASQYFTKSKKSEVAEPDLGTDSDPDDEDEIGKGWEKARRKVMRKRLHHGHHQHAAAEERGVMKWFRDLMDF